jgi:hypothetical protein
VAADAKQKRDHAQRQLALDNDYAGFSFMPRDLSDQYVVEMRVNAKSEEGKDVAAKLFQHVTNFVAIHHGWHTGGDLVPSLHLQIEIKPDQIALLNPTSRDVQMAAILDQCIEKKTTKKIARRRIEFISGNVNSYARILNGPHQLERIKTFNDLSASIAVLKAEASENEAKAKAEKEMKDAEKAAAKAKKKKEQDEERDKLAPGCRDDVEKGIEHVLSLNMTQRKQILKYHFGVQSGLYKMKPSETERMIHGFMAQNNFDDKPLPENLDGIPLPELPPVDEAVEEGDETGDLC